MDRIPPRIVPAIVEFVYGDLSKFPRRVGKPLERDLAGSFSARRGPYRVLYDIDDEANTIAILRVDHRADVYRRQ
ncbi:toxin RelG [Subtercola lobariae]|uniref:Toxin RelG n=2 Tax=Subtercola lobariae TaxID=1588641 RepID=A0A917B1S3_9MICO|nr:toxin RelG [Subtercola lobariae]